LDLAKYQTNSARCLNDKRAIVQGLHLYAADHAGQFPYQDHLGWGQIMPPSDHHCFPINELQQSYGIPYGLWICAVYNPDLNQRTVIVSNAVANGIASGTWKWIAPVAVTYWVEQGGAGGGYCEYANPANNILSRNLNSLSGTNAVIADLMYCTTPGQPYGGQHIYGGQITQSNIAFADGHAEMRPVSDVRQRFSPWTVAY
jgi:prepilin-type processing-associated H-X9-DG protein